MTEAALSVAIAAIAITLFGVILQWLAYRATTDQLAAIGRENARFGEGVTRSLGQIYEVATGTRGSVESAFLPLVSLLREVRGQPAPRAPEHWDQREWRIEQAQRVLGASDMTALVVAYLTPDGHPERDFIEYVAGSKPEGEDSRWWVMKAVATLAAMNALDLVDIDRQTDRLVFTEAGREVALALGKPPAAEGSPSANG